MITTSAALRVTKRRPASTTVDLAAVEAYIEHIGQIVGGMGGPGTNKVHSIGRQWLVAIREHQQGHLRLGAEVLRKDPQPDAARGDRMLAPVANPDRSAG